MTWRASGSASIAARGRIARHPRILTRSRLATRSASARSKRSGCPRPKPYSTQSPDFTRAAAASALISLRLSLPSNDVGIENQVLHAAEVSASMPRLKIQTIGGGAHYLGAARVAMLALAITIGVGIGYFLT